MSSRKTSPSPPWLTNLTLVVSVLVWLIVTYLLFGDHIPYSGCSARDGSYCTAPQYTLFGWIIYWSWFVAAATMGGISIIKLFGWHRQRRSTKKKDKKV